MSHLLSLSRHLGAWGLVMLSATSVQAQSRTSQTWLTVPDSTLAQMRGGFALDTGLLVTLGISRTLYINGALITESTLNLGQLSQLTTAQAAQIGQQLLSLNLVQNGPGNTFVSAPAAAVAAQIPPINPAPATTPTATSTPTATTSPTAAVSSPTTPAPATTTTPVASSASTPAGAGAPSNAATTAPPTTGPTVTVSSAATVPAATTSPTPAVTPPAGSTTNVGGASAAPAPTAIVSIIPGIGPGLVIQNSLNNQSIINSTTLDITSNGLSMLRAAQLQADIANAVQRSIGSP
ncbi:hypothetical protein [Oryzisolibacter sp. LB2S]|uniref:hypothetical protein n=1 Tax=Alicycliphilus soli TaxID=3228789 RepID=UPI003457D0AE